MVESNNESSWSVEGIIPQRFYEVIKGYAFVQNALFGASVDSADQIIS